MTDAEIADRLPPGTDAEKARELVERALQRAQPGALYQPVKVLLEAAQVYATLATSATTEAHGAEPTPGVRDPSDPMLDRITRLLGVSIDNPEFKRTNVSWPKPGQLLVGVETQDGSQWLVDLSITKYVLTPGVTP